METNIIIACPACEWQPDGEAYWRCSCGFNWNTFDTAGKCPACKKQWEITYCPGCGKTTPHKEWYHDKSMPLENTDSPEKIVLKQKKRALENRLATLGIKTRRVSYLPYLDHSTEQFQTPYEAGCRMLILNAIAYAVHNLHDRQKLVAWFKRENIWDRVSPEEKDFFIEAAPPKEELIDLSWRIEGALTLGWALNLLDTLHEINRNETDEEMDRFTSSIPGLGAPIQQFLHNLSFRDLGEVYIENLVNETATGYFRDLFFYGNKDETTINRMSSYERHKTLNWLRQFSDISTWDDTDTST